MKLSDINFFKKRNAESRKDIIVYDNHFALESFRSLRTNLQFSLVDTLGCKKVMITSAVIKEGKSTVAINLAISLAFAKFRTLIVDCDLRKPRLHRFLDKPCTPGLSDCLIGKVNMQDAIVKYDGNPNLDFIFAGRVPPNSLELLGSNEMKDFIAKLEENYDYIIFDTPPALSVSDSVVLSSRVNGVIIVCKERETKKVALKNTVDAFNIINAKILGFVLNNVRMTKKKDYRYEYYNTQNN